MKKPFDPSSSLYVYVLVREDLPPAAQAVQACHAAMSAARLSPSMDQERLVLLQVKDRDHLLRCAEKLSSRGIDFSIFFEPDHDWGETALATHPHVNKISDLQKLPLAKF